ncbi:MAG: hypothetical protein ACK2UO_05950 [Caldilineaceae bacterium]|jgi:hypothetical protein
MNPNVPTGNDSETVRQYFQYLYAHYLSGITQQYYIHWDVIAFVILWIFILVAGFYAYTRWQRYTRASKEPYPVETYNGYIQEGNGPVGLFLRLFFIGMGLWLLATTLHDLLRGQIY